MTMAMSQFQFRLVLLNNEAETPLSTRRKSLYRGQYNALGKRNFPAIQRIVACKHQQRLAFNRLHPFIDVLPSGITESGEVLDAGYIA